MKLARILVAFLSLSFLSCAAFKDNREYAAAHALEAKQPNVSFTMDEAQLFANRVTDGEHQPLIRSILHYPYLADALQNDGAIAAYMSDTRTIFSANSTIRYKFLVHELAHAICYAGPHCDGPPHGPLFVAMERKLFAKYRP